MALTIESINTQALDAQRRRIQVWMLAYFIDGTAHIETWNDDRFHLSWFYTPRFGSWSDSAVRRWMRRLAESGAVEIRQDRKGGSIRYRYPRAICDKLAEEAIKYWQERGYSQDKRSPRERATSGD